MKEEWHIVTRDADDKDDHYDAELLHVVRSLNMLYPTSPTNNACCPYECRRCVQHELLRVTCDATASTNTLVYQLTAAAADWKLRR